MKERLRSIRAWMKKRWQMLTIVGSIPFILAIYPTFVLGYTWIKVSQSGVSAVSAGEPNDFFGQDQAAFGASTGEWNDTATHSPPWWNGVVWDFSPPPAITVIEFDF